ncbi:hypothetical protein D3C76_556160 [compost metagenome]
MGRMDLHPGKAGQFAQSSGTGKALDHLVDDFLCHRLGCVEEFGHLAQVQRNCRRRPGLLSQAGLHLAAGVVDLQPELRPTGSTDPGPAPELLQVPVVFQHHAAGARHGAAVDHHVASDKQAGATIGPGLVETHQLPGRGLVGIRHVLFHGGLGDAVRNGRTVGERQLVEHVHGATSSDRGPTLRLKLTLMSIGFLAWAHPLCTSNDPHLDA